MGQTRRVYRVMDAALSAVDCAPLSSGHERCLRGDIIALRRPAPYLGTKELALYIWVRLEGLEENLMSALTVPVATDGDPRVLYDKRRYCIPFGRLKAMLPAFDETKASDPLVVYQPWMMVDEDSPHAIVAVRPPLDVHGVVFDRVTGRYL